MSTVGGGGGGGGDTLMATPPQRGREPSNVEAVLLKMAKLSERADAVSSNLQKQMEENQKKLELRKEEKARSRRVRSSQSLGSLAQFQETLMGGSALLLEPLSENGEDAGGNGEIKARNIIGDLLASINQDEDEGSRANTPAKRSRGRLGVGNKRKEQRINE
ncbi:hypothetical protein BC829DRAFT_397852 [Chytridium lagenaria]|nr:hypothetical protein BC829DRAFT_397852 [Chytridium lagenaria]